MDDVRAEIEINASPERVWKVLTDFSSYSSWNPLITSAGGTAKTDSVLTLRLQPPQSRTLALKARVLHYERLRQIRWRGAAWGVPLLLSSEQSFTLEALPDGRTKVVQQAAATGLLRGLIGPSDQHALSGLEAMNQALKARAEADAPSSEVEKHTR